MDLQKRSDMLDKAKKMLSDKSSSAKLRKDGKKTAYELMNIFFDDGTFSEIGAYVKAYANEIGSSDPSSYEGVICGYGAVDGRLVFAYAQDASRQNGAFSRAACEKVAALYDLALKNGAPVVSIFDSLGVKVEEGIDVLAGYGKIMRKSAKVKGKLPQISVVLGNACGANSIISSMADALVICEGASFSLFPSNVLVANGAKKNAGTAKAAFESGYASDYAETSEQALESARSILSYLPSNKLDKNVYAGVEDNPNRLTPEIASLVSGAYDAHAVIASISDGNVYKELTAAKGKALITAFSFIGGIPVGIIATNPAHENGKLCAGCVRKAANFIKLCNSFGISILTLVGTEGFYEVCEANGGRLTELSAGLAAAYASAEVPLITVNIGEAYGSAYAVLGSKAIGADIVYALDTAKISVLKPDSAVAMLWSEKLAGSKAPIEKRKALEEEWSLYMSTPLLSANAGQVDDIITADMLRAKVASALEMLSMKSEFVKL